MIRLGIEIYVIGCIAFAAYLVVRKPSSRKSLEPVKSAWPVGRPVLDYTHGPNLLSASRSWNLTSGEPMDILIGEYGMVSILSDGQVIHQEMLVESPFSAIRDFESTGVQDE